MNHLKLNSLLCLALLSSSVVHAASNLEARRTFDADKKAAAARYSEDKKLCAEDPVSSARMQCLRDAKAEYDKMLAAAKTKFASASKTPAANNAPTTHDKKANSANTACKDCGKVTAVNVSEREGKSGPLGVIAGGVAGAALGNQVGKGTGKDLATIAGAVGGAYAGHKIEQKMGATKVWTVNVHFDSGEDRSFTFEHDPGYKVGDAVKTAGASISYR